MSAFKTREKFDIHAKIREHKLDPRVADLLEESRPLTTSSLVKVSQNIERLSENMADIKERVLIMPPPFWLGAGIEFVGEYTDLWTFAVCQGISHRIYTGDFTEQDAYSTLCQAAGSCLRAPAAEPFRLVLSMITKAGLRPVEFDQSPTLNLPVGTPPEKWQRLADVYASLEEVKGARIVESLAVGIGFHLLEGKVTKKEAARLFKTAHPWRASSPIPQLLRGETRC
jgi:hypothetical protein